MPSSLSTLPDLSLISIFTYLPPKDLLQVGQITSRWLPLQRAAINARNRKTLTLLIGDQAESLITASPFPKAEAGLSAKILRQKTLTQSTITRLTTNHRDLRSLHIAYCSSWPGLDHLQVLLQFWQSTLTTLTLRFNLKYTKKRTQRLQSFFSAINTLSALRRLTIECTFTLAHPGPALQAVLSRLEEFYFSAPSLSIPPGHVGILSATWPSHYAPALQANRLIRRIEIPITVWFSDLPVLYELPCRAAIRRLHLKDAFITLVRLSADRLDTLCTNLIGLEVLEFDVDPSISMARLATCLVNLSNLVELHLGLNFCAFSRTGELLALPPNWNLPSLPTVRRLYLNLKLLYHDQLPWNPFVALFPNLEQLKLDGLSIRHPVFCRLSQTIILEPHCAQCFSEGVDSSGVRCLRMIIQIWVQHCPRLKRIHWPFGETENRFEGSGGEPL